MTEQFEFPDGELPDDLRALDEELSSIRYEERASFVPELRAELERAWADEPARRRSVRRRRLATAALIALLLGGASVPSARASLVRLIDVLTPEAPISVEPVAEAVEPEAIELRPASTPAPEPEPTLPAEAPSDVTPTPTTELTDVSRIPPRMLDRDEARRSLQEVYPEALQLGGIGGSVLLRMRVDESGRVSEPSVMRSSGVDELDRAALELAPRFRFVPALQAGEAVGTWIEFPVLFDPRPESAEPSRSLNPVVDPLSLPTIDKDEWWQLYEPLDLDELSEPTWTGPTADAELDEAERSLEEALGDPTILERYGPVAAILRGVAPESVMPTEWRTAVGDALSGAVDRGTGTPASLLALGRIRKRQGVRAQARRLFERGLQMAVREGADVSDWVVAELHHERGSLVRDNWRASAGVGRVRAEAFGEASCSAARSSGWAGTGFASVERLIAWNYLCPGEMGTVFEAGFDELEGGSADLTLMMASYRAAIEAYPPHETANRDFLMILASQGRWEDVLTGARRFTRVSGGHPDGLLLAGMALHRLDRSEEAEPLLDEALARMDPSRRDGIANVGPLLEAQDRDRYRQLTAAERRVWERDYWSTKDRIPATVVNERRVEHIVRGAYADLVLGGVVGDAGEVWIRFGGPDAIHIVDGGSGRLTEFWDYGSGPDITFVRWVSSERMDLTPEGRAYVDDLGRLFSPE